MSQWYQGETSLWRTCQQCLFHFPIWEEAQPKNLHVVHLIISIFWISSAASEPTPVFSPKPCRRHYFWFSGLFRRNHVADVFGLFCQNHVADLGHGNHSGELLLFVGCIVTFFVSYLICMFQDSVPAGSYNDPFLSSVCVYTVITNGFSSCHRSCTIQKKQGAEIPMSLSLPTKLGDMW